VLIDILFAPYVFFFATTYSQFIVFFWFLTKRKSFFKTKEVQFYFAILFFILLSVVMSIFRLPSEYVFEFSIENFKRGINIGMAISYYFFFYYMFMTLNVKFEKWLYFFTLFVTIWGIIYYVNLSQFLQLKVLFNPRDATLSNLYRDGFFLRYNFIWTDPNNVGYTLVAVATLLISSNRVTNIQLIIITLSLIFCMLIIMSAGSIISALLFIPFAVIIRLKKSKSFLRILTIFLSVVLLVLLIQKYSDYFLNSEIGKVAFDRIENKNETGDTRPEIWKELIESKNLLFYFFVGEGTVIFVNNKPFSPHSGHFVFIFGFGVVAYCLYMFVIFRKTKSQSWLSYVYLLPLFICFTLNIGIGELKFAAIMYLLVAFSRTYKFKEGLKNKNSDSF
jgi:hypothetical protein